MKNLLTVLLLIVSVIMIISILLQPSKNDGFAGFTGGGQDTFYAKNNIKTSESVLARITVISAILFAAIVIAMNMIK